MSNDRSEDIYERLAAALEALPHGFARTPSGVEIKLMKKAFTPEEVWLAGQLTRIPETAAEIAKRVGRDVVEVTALLESLIPRGLVALPGIDGGGRNSEGGHGGREEIPAAPVHGRLVRGRHAPPGQGVRRAVRAVHHRRRGRARLRAAAGAAGRGSRTGFGQAGVMSSASPTSTSTPTSSGTSASSSSPACARGSGEILDGSSCKCP